MSKRTAEAMSMAPPSMSMAQVSVSPIDYQHQFTEWHDAHVAGGYVSAYHPKGGAILHDENLQKETFSMLDYYIAHPEKLVTNIMIFARSMAPFITEKFASQYTEGDRATWTEMVLNTNPIENAARGTLASMITVSRVSNSIKLNFMTQGFVTDLNTYKLEGGRQRFEAHVKAVASNVIHSIMLDAISRVRWAVFAYNKPEDAMPDVMMPTTIEDADRIVRLHHHELTRHDLGIKKVITRAAIMFNAMNENIDGVMLSADLYDMVTTEDVNVSYITGRSAIQSRYSITKPIEHRFYIIPALSDQRSNETDEMLLKIRHQSGSAARHVNCTINMPPGKFRSRMVNFQKASWEMNGFSEYEKRDSFQHCLQFQACDYIPRETNPSGAIRFTPTNDKPKDHKQYTDAGESLPGHLNRTLINNFINSYSRIMRRVRTRDDLETSMRMYSCVVRYDETMIHVPNDGTPINGGMIIAGTAGEVDPVFAKADHIANVCKTAGARLFDGFSREQMDVFMWGLHFAEELNTKKPCSFNDTLNELSNMFDGIRSEVGVDKIISSCDIESLRTKGNIGTMKQSMIAVNRHGGIPTTPMNKMSGYGNISGLFTIADEIMEGRLHTDFPYKTKLLQFVELFQRFARNALVCMPSSPLVDPRMCPYYHTAAHVSQFTRTCIVLWYGITRFLPPLFVCVTPTSGPVRFNDASETPDLPRDHYIGPSGTEKLKIYGRTEDDYVRLAAKSRKKESDRLEASNARQPQHSYQQGSHLGQISHANVGQIVDSGPQGQSSSYTSPHQQGSPLRHQAAVYVQGQHEIAGRDDPVNKRLYYYRYKATNNDNNSGSRDVATLSQILVKGVGTETQFPEVLLEGTVLFYTPISGTEYEYIGPRKVAPLLNPVYDSENGGEWAFPEKKIILAAKRIPVSVTDGSGNTTEFDQDVIEPQEVHAYSPVKLISQPPDVKHIKKFSQTREIIDLSPDDELFLAKLPDPKLDTSKSKIVSPEQPPTPVFSSSPPVFSSSPPVFTSPIFGFDMHSDPQIAMESEMYMKIKNAKSSSMYPMISRAGNMIILPLTSTNIENLASDGSSKSGKFIPGVVCLATVLTHDVNVPKNEKHKHAQHSLLWTRFKHVPCAMTDINLSPFISSTGCSIGDSILGALPFINPRYPMIPMSVHTWNEVNIKEMRSFINAHGKECNFQNFMFATGYPMTALSHEYPGTQYVEQYRNAIGKEEAYWAFQRRFGREVPHVLAHLIFFPPTGNPFNPKTETHPLSTMERRWISLEYMPDQARIGGRIALTTENSLHALVRQCDENIDTVFSVVVLTPWEEQLNHSLVAVAKGQLGTLYHNQKNDQPNEITSTEVIPQREQTIRELQFATAWQYQRRAMVIPNVAGSDTIGGNGMGWFDTLTPRPAFLKSANDPYLNELRKFNFNAAKIKNKSNMACLVGMSSCIGKKSHNQSIDICGYPDRRNYIGVMHQCDEFDNLKQTKLRWDGAPWFAYIHNPQEIKETLPVVYYDQMNLHELEQSQVYNSLCHPTTLRFTDAFDQECEDDGLHLRGYQGRNCRHEAESHRRIGAF